MFEKPPLSPLAPPGQAGPRPAGGGQATVAPRTTAAAPAAIAPSCDLAPASVANAMPAPPAPPPAPPEPGPTAAPAATPAVAPPAQPPALPAAMPAPPAAGPSTAPPPPPHPPPAPPGHSPAAWSMFLGAIVTLGAALPPPLPAVLTQPPRPPCPPAAAAHALRPGGLATKRRGRPPGPSRMAAAAAAATAAAAAAAPHPHAANLHQGTFGVYVANRAFARLMTSDTDTRFLHLPRDMAEGLLPDILFFQAVGVRGGSNKRISPTASLSRPIFAAHMRLIDEEGTIWPM